MTEYDSYFYRDTIRVKFIEGKRKFREGPYAYLLINYSDKNLLH